MSYGIPENSLLESIDSIIEEAISELNESVSRNLLKESEDDDDYEEANAKKNKKDDGDDEEDDDEKKQESCMKDAKINAGKEKA
jgi:hypothetical protein